MQIDSVVQQCATRREQFALRTHGPGLGLEYHQVAADTLRVASLGQALGCDGLLGAFLECHDLTLQELLGGEGRFDLAIGLQDRTDVAGEGFVLAGGGLIHPGPQAAALEQWLDQIGRDRPDAEVPVEKVGDLQCECASATGQAQPRVQRALGRFPALIVRRQTSLGGHEVGATRDDFCGEAGRWRRGQLGEAGAGKLFEQLGRGVAGEHYLERPERPVELLLAPRLERLRPGQVRQRQAKVERRANPHLVALANPVGSDAKTLGTRPGQLDLLDGLRDREPDLGRLSGQREACAGQVRVDGLRFGQCRACARTQSAPQIDLPRDVE